VCKGCRDQASDVDLPDAVQSGPGEQGMLLDERQSVVDCGLMGAFDHGRDRRIRDCPQRRDRLHRRERQVIPGNGLCLRPGVFRDLARQLPGIDRLPAVCGQEKLAGHLGPHSGPICGRQRRVGRQVGRAVDHGNAPGDLKPERAYVAVDKPERRSKTGRILEVPEGEVRSLQLPLAELGQWMQTAAEQRSHLVGGHGVAGGQAIDPVQAGTDPQPRRLAPFGVVGREPGVTFLGCVQGGDLPSQVVISGPGAEFVDVHRHTHPKGVQAAGAVRPSRAASGGAWGVSHSSSASKLGVRQTGAEC
jgi:hypothetical protein